MFGYHGQYLRISLPEGRAEVVPLAADVLRRFIGGVGLAAWVLHRECPVGVEPFEPASPIVFAFSPFVGTPLTTSAKFAVAAKSPLTNRFNDALSSSQFAIHGKQTGFDAIVVVGKCSQPAIILIDDGRVSLEAAGNLWGQDLPTTSAGLSERFGPSWTFGAIGPAGERQVRFATLSFDGRHAGRGGHGAVLGSKSVKAIGVRGTQRVAVADPVGLIAAAKDLSARSFGPTTATIREHGTIGNLLAFNRLNALPTRNFQAGQFEGIDAISGTTLNAESLVAKKSCAACTIGCEQIFRVESRPTGDPSPKKVRLEYESLFALGPLCGVSDRDAVLRAARACDDLGLDTISAGATIAFAMECSAKGLIPHRIEFGDGDMVLTLLGLIARREGLGDLLADGTRRAASVIGGEAPSFAPHVKGLEIPGYDPRALQTMALGFAVGSRGADHNRSGAYEADLVVGTNRRHGSADSAGPAIASEDRAALIDSLILCKFLRSVFTDLWTETADLLAKVTGWDVNADELRTGAHRVVTAKKLFNVREGWTPAEDTLPERFLTEGLPDGTEPGATLPAERLREMIAAYYAARGWDVDGSVPASIIAELGLGDL